MAQIRTSTRTGQAAIIALGLALAALGGCFRLTELGAARVRTSVPELLPGLQPAQPRPYRLSPPVTVVVDASHAAWTQTGIVVQPGEVIWITATGEITWQNDKPSVGPEGTAYVPSPNLSAPWEFPEPKSGIGALVGKVGDWVFPVGRHAEVRAKRGGQLLLAANDRWYEDAFRDNAGSFVARIRVQQGGDQRWLPLLP